MGIIVRIGAAPGGYYDSQMSQLRTKLPIGAVERRTGTLPLRTILQQSAASSGLSRDQLAAKAGLSRKGLYNLLNGDGDPQLSSIDALAHALDLELVLAPKAASQMQLDQPPSPRRSDHSRIHRLMADADHLLAQSRN
ncbi:DNA-binding protein [Pseudorhodoferax soli]|uniref:Helix-turn-helix protein n=1 Tax=Pseudorhodoferax soli TaxID=545864 RepID=A0A368XND2_9BURK|nr:helix-turn-helix domain-containing protein [Pseudorhodoferax soli]RCW69490.1 helix-turn-helix protein [Pseudorhodoferax soli]